MKISLIQKQLQKICIHPRCARRCIVTRIGNHNRICFTVTCHINGLLRLNQIALKPEFVTSLIDFFRYFPRPSHRPVIILRFSWHDHNGRVSIFGVCRMHGNKKGCTCRLTFRFHLLKPRNNGTQGFIPGKRRISAQQHRKPYKSRRNFNSPKSKINQSLCRYTIGILLILMGRRMVCTQNVRIFCNIRRKIAMGIHTNRNGNLISHRLADLPQHKQFSAANILRIDCSMQLKPDSADIFLLPDLCNNLIHIISVSLFLNNSGGHPSGKGTGNYFGPGRPECMDRTRKIVQQLLSFHLNEILFFS